MMLRGLFWQIMITLIEGGVLSTGLTLAIAMPLVLRTPCKRPRSEVLLLRWP